MMPGLNGYEVLPRLRERKIWTLEMMLTAKDGDYDQTDAFDLGADDYMTKPFSFTVLRARLRALVRRGAPERPAILSVGSLTVDPALRRAACNGTEIRLTVKEFALLEYLTRNAIVGPSGAAGWDRTGLVKGGAVGTAADSLRALEQVTLSINAGGDVVCGLGKHSAELARPWNIGIEDPADRSRIAQVIPVVDGALATSSATARARISSIPAPDEESSIRDPPLSPALTSCGPTCGPRRRSSIPLRSTTAQVGPAIGCTQYETQYENCHARSRRLPASRSREIGHPGLCCRF